MTRFLILALTSILFLSTAHLAAADGRDGPECRLPHQSEWPSPARWVENRSAEEAQAVGIYYWDTVGLERLGQAYHPFVTWKSSNKPSRRAKAWAACLRADEKSVDCGFASRKGNLNRFYQKKKVKGLPKSPPDTAIACAVPFIGRCFGERSANMSLAQGTLQEGPFPRAKCEYAIGKYDELTKEGTYLADYVRSWYSRTKYDMFKKRETCLQIPKFAVDGIAANDPLWLETSGTVLAEQTAVSDRETLLANARAANPDGFARIHTPRGNPLSYDPKTTLRAIEMKRADHAALAETYTKDASGVAQLKAAVEQGCAPCALELADIHEHGLYGAEPSTHLAIRYALIYHDLADYVQYTDYREKQLGSGIYQAIRLIKTLPRDQLGAFAPAREWMDRKWTHGEDYKAYYRSGLAVTLRRAQTSGLFDIRVRDLDPRTMVLADVQTIRGVSALIALSDAVQQFRSPGGQIYQGQAAAIRFAAKNGDRQSALWLARWYDAENSKDTPEYYRAVHAISAGDGQAAFWLSLYYGRNDKQWDARTWANYAAQYGYPGARERAAQITASINAAQAARLPPATPQATYTLSDGFQDMAAAIERDRKAFADCMSRSTSGYCVKD
ncbi:MAG: hypothetical protein AAGH90_01640 [Pseudomonadota bacterium]